MHRNIAKASARNLRQTYIQQYLKSFLRRVHPDLFHSHPKEQLRNSTSLQDLLPLISHEKTKHADTPLLYSKNDTESGPTKVAFYFKPKTSDDRSQATLPGQKKLEFTEHLLPDPNPTISPTQGASRPNLMVLEREVKSWQMVQSFMELCQKVGVSVKDSDQQDIAKQLEQSVREASTQNRLTHSQEPQKPLSEVFEEELKGSLSGSGVGTGGTGLSEMHLGKAGATPLALDATMMIESNPLLFRGPTLSPSRLSKVVRTWIFWQEEDQELVASSSGSGPQLTPFRLSEWWRKVPVMVLSSSKERAEILRSAPTPDDKGSGTPRGAVPGKGILVVDQEMSKQEMTCYLRDNLERIQREYKELLIGAHGQGPSQRLPPLQRSSTSQEGRQLSPDAASYLERMRARAQLQDARARSAKR
ncbi:MAG: hypothetical protein J3Q66DRAFT_335729 [Benniella sp.]|nr:MAG: hypothetical protein J3Q66DRAFT_335729 [Benniella sp.]